MGVDRHRVRVADRPPQLTEVMAALREGDTLGVWRLDRLGRSMREAIDTTTPGGRLVFHIFEASCRRLAVEPSLVVRKHLTPQSPCRWARRSGTQNSPWWGSCTTI